MQPLILIAAALAVLIVIVAVVFVAFKRPAAGDAQPGAHPYQKEPSLLSPAERAFFGVLEAAVAGRHRVMVKVRLADIIQVQGGTPFAERERAMDQISTRHIDFVLCRPADLRPEAAIELDETGKTGADRTDFIDDALNAAGLPLYRLNGRQPWRVPELQATLKLALADAKAEGKAAESRKTEVFNPGPAPSCRVCGATMVLRTLTHSDHSTEYFWGCVNYPKCKAAQPLKEKEAGAKEA
jgi:hypothetical protein